jgi:SAM-dependent methyltransferase
VIGDRDRWNQRWRDAVPAAPSAFVASQLGALPVTGRALDVAGGAGRDAVALARHGLDVTVVDVSDAGLERAGEHAIAAGVGLHLVRADLDDEALPVGPWDVIVVNHFLCRALWPALSAALAPGGRLLLCQPTRSNLERHPSPSARFLVDDGELLAFARSAGLDIVHHREGWTDSGRHEAELVARRPG